MPSDAPASVPLPRATANGTLTKNKPPVWAIDSSGPSVQTPLPAKCARHTREGEICCQELKGDDERQLIDPDVIRDVYVTFFFFIFFVSGGAATCPTTPLKQALICLPVPSQRYRPLGRPHCALRACRGPVVPRRV
jgi:hypothetical protein